MREKKKERETLNNVGQKIHKNVIHCHSKVEKKKKEINIQAGRKKERKKERQKERKKGGIAKR